MRTGDMRDLTRPPETGGPLEGSEGGEREEEERRREKVREGRDREAAQDPDREQQDNQGTQVHDMAGGKRAGTRFSALEATNTKQGLLRPPSFSRRPSQRITAKGPVVQDASETDSLSDPGDVVLVPRRPAAHGHSRGESIGQGPSLFHTHPQAAPQVRNPPHSKEEIIRTKPPSPAFVKPIPRSIDAASPLGNQSFISAYNTTAFDGLLRSNTRKNAVQAPVPATRGIPETGYDSVRGQANVPTKGLYQLHEHSSTSLLSKTRGASPSSAKPAPQIWKPASTQKDDVVQPTHLSSRLGRLGSNFGSTTSITSTSPAEHSPSATDSERSDNEAARQRQVPVMPKVPKPQRTMPAPSFKPLPPLPTSALQTEKKSGYKSVESERLSDWSFIDISASFSATQSEEARSYPKIVVQDYESLPSMSNRPGARYRHADIRAFDDGPPANLENKNSFATNASERYIRPGTSTERMPSPGALSPDPADAAFKALRRLPSTTSDGRGPSPQRSGTGSSTSRRTSANDVPLSHAGRVSPSISHGETSSSDASSPPSDWEAAKPKIDGTVSAAGSQTAALSNPAPGSDVRANPGRLVLNKLSAIFEDRALYRGLLSSNPSDSQTILDVFQMLLDTRDLHDRRRRQLITAMRRLSAKTKLYPRRFNLNGPVHVLSEHPVTSGSYADIYRAYSQGEDLCLKVIKAYKPSLVEHMSKVYAKEAILWGQLSHPNVLPFYGLSPFHTQIAFVSPWAENGHLGDFLERNPRANRPLLCSDTAAGIAYLHAHTIVHGDLKAANVLVDDSGRACLADFGLSSVTDPQILHWATQSSVASRGGSIRWQAPELHVPAQDDSAEDKIVHNSKETDVFAWACLCYEIFTGHLPFFEIRSEATVLLKVILGGRPTRPPETTDAWLERGLTPHMWALMDDCWKFKPTQRPDINAVLARLELEKPVDERPPAQWGGKSAMRFRNFHDASVHRQQRRPTLRDLDSILSRLTPST
ncbi:putative regulation of ATP:ADP antiporter activity [Lyophyllum shimeji]|uniref:Regulation of ATP:ADP antiporter activity n=1 Tax=Lyophyllum shimeji TaxID=47721 RepID=A0A9P3PMB1_LYOSH|nr:putative regulation of ATP:ADP antiporter activity [Lyophyllum shimeji]